VVPPGADRAAPAGRLILDGARATRIGEVGAGFGLAMRTLDTFRVSVGAAAVGMARRALDEATRHVRARVQFGKPLAEQPLVQAHLADMATQVDSARLLTWRAAAVKDAGARGTVEVSMAKLHATEAAQDVIDRAVQLLGGRGVVPARWSSTCTGRSARCASTKAPARSSATIIGRAIATGGSP
jgi:acyl-CoA dehydrogenase